MYWSCFKKLIHYLTGNSLLYKCNQLWNAINTDAMSMGGLNGIARRIGGIIVEPL